jgi:hypothetical protein
VTDSDPAERVRTLLLRGDNVLKHGRSEDKAREVAEEGQLDERIRQLIEHRLEQLA